MALHLPEIPGYALIDLIGRGGMTDVFAGVQLSLKRPVAIKVRRSRLDEHDETLKKRFSNAARIHGSVSHPNVVQIFEFVETEHCQALILERLWGPTLAERIYASNGLPIHESLQTILSIADSLQYLHHRNIVHRDVKPSNIIYASARGWSTPKLTDFGVVKMPEQNADLTVDGAQIGTFWYMSPEQFSNGRVEPSWDVFSLAVTLYEMIAGHLPLRERDQASVFRRHIDSEPIPMWSDSLMERHSELFHIIAAALESEPQKRLRRLDLFVALLQIYALRFAPELTKRVTVHRSDWSDVEASFAGRPPQVVKRLMKLVEASEGKCDLMNTVESHSIDDVNGPRCMDDTLITSVVDDSDDAN